MRILISGASGLIGTALTAACEADGHEVIRMVRRPAAGPHETTWDPAGLIDDDAVASADVVVNLAGASIGAKRLTARYKREVMSSRVEGTRTIALAIAATGGKAHLLQGSSMGFYGDASSAPLDESAPRGEGFLADVCVAWEAAAAPAVNAGATVTYLRTGLVMSAHGGFADRLLPMVRRGLFGGFGSGTAIQSWITLGDHVRAVRSLMETPHAGPVNMIAPSPVTDGELVAALARAFGKGTGLRAPAWALRLVVGEAIEDLLASQNGVPAVLRSRGFEWESPLIEDAAQRVAAEYRALTAR